jgi:transcription-repair coupling factor (superfamily II helicase)
VLVASAASLAPRVTSPARLLAASIDLKPGQDVSPLDLAELLVDAGFTREDPADEDGEFAVRGEIVDIFAAGDAPPVRLEFIGDTIETLRTYDPATQRSIAAIEQILVKAKVEIFTKTDLENRQVAMLRQIENDEQALKQENMTMASDTSAVRSYQNPSSVLAVHAMGMAASGQKSPRTVQFLVSKGPVEWGHTKEELRVSSSKG